MTAGLLATQEARSNLAPSNDTPLLYLSDMEFSGIPDPRKIDYAGDWLVSNHPWGRLVRFGEIGSESEDLSQSWTRSRDGLLWKFKLRDGARWSDGSELTADDVVASLKESLSGTVHTRLASYVSSVKSEGKSIIVFALKTLPENFLFSLACPDFAITDTRKKPEKIGNAKGVIRPPTKLGGVSQEVFDQWLKEAVKKEPEPKKT